jgi:hypothetical protein
MNKYFGFIARGQFMPQDTKTADAFKAARRNLEGQDVYVCLEKADKISSDNQLRYYFGVIVRTWCELTGYTKDEMHVVLKTKFLKTIDRFGLEYLPSYRDLSTADAEVYHENCRRLALEMFGAVIALPNETIITDSDLRY